MSQTHHAPSPVAPPAPKQYIPINQSAMPPMFQMISEMANHQDRKTQRGFSSSIVDQTEGGDSEIHSPVAADDWISPFAPGDVDGEDGEEERDEVNGLPDQDDISRHNVFRSPSFDSEDLAARLAQLSVSGLGTGRSAERSGGANDEGDVSDEDKMAAIWEEFGAFEGERDERFLTEAKGGLFKGIVVIGNLHLTTHRVTFNAVIPPAQLVETGHGQASGSSTLVIKAGPVYFPRSSSLLKKKKKVWMELGIDMASVYPDSTEAGRTKPLHTLLLSSLKRVLPGDTDDPLSLEIIYSFPDSGGDETLKLTFDTQEAALSWRREFEGALFHFDRMQLVKRKAGSGSLEEAERGAQGAGFGKMEDWDRVKISIPLERIVKKAVSDYMAFATLLVLGIDNRQPGEGVGDDEPVELQFALLSSQLHFLDIFEHALKASDERKAARPAGELGPFPVLDLDGSLRFFLNNPEGASSRAAAAGEEKLEDGGSGKGGEEEGVGDSQLRANFGLGEHEPIWSTRCGLARGLVPFFGQLIVSQRYVGFYRKTFGSHNIIYRFPLSDVRGASKWSSLHFSSKGLTLQIGGHSDMHFEFFSKTSRDEAIQKINQTVATDRRQPLFPSRHSSSPIDHLPASPLIISSDGFSSTPPSYDVERPSVTSVRQDGHTRDDSPSRSRSFDILSKRLAGGTSPSNPRLTDKQYNFLPKIVNYPENISREPISPRHFTMLTIGSRGDIQPYIALSLGLMAHGHRCTIVTHDEFKTWIESYGIGHRQAGGDPAALMKLSIEHKMFTPSWFKESLGSYRGWLDDLLHDAWVACQDADVLIESPSAFAGIHIAESLSIPYFRAFTMPWTRTHEVPHAFLTPSVELSAQFNYATYVMFDNVMWKAISGQVNRWRKTQLDIKSTNMTLLEQRQVPFLYNFSTAVLPHPIDWKDNIMITGYWFLENSDAEWSAPDSLVAFIEQAREDNKPIVYIGFGSIVVSDPVEMTKNIIRAVEKADVRAIIAKGWSSRGQAAEHDVPFPSSCYSIEKIPHDWLFPKIDVCVHHGGAGTTGASLRWGKPTVIKPWFGDQFCWASQVSKLNCGVRVTSLSGNELADALIKATQNPLIKEAAAKVGERIRSEHGVETAIDCIYSYLHRARDRHVSYKPPRATSPRPLSFPLLRSPLQPSLAKRSSSPTTINRQDT